MHDEIDREYEEQVAEAEEMVHSGKLISARVINWDGVIIFEFVAPEDCISLDCRDLGDWTSNPDDPTDLEIL